MKIRRVAAKPKKRLAKRHAAKPATIPPWPQRLQVRLQGLFAANPATARAGIKSFTDLVDRVVRGFGPNGNQLNPGLGARMCINIAAVHVRAFCNNSRARVQPAYLNAYDVARAGGRPVSTLRQSIDSSLPLPVPQTPQTTYFGAVEVTGCGIRFYGDVCLILRPESLRANTVVLDRNSYDLDRLPLSDEVAHIMRTTKLTLQRARQRVVNRLHGTWSTDLAAMSGLKVADAALPRSRRLTVGLVAAGMLEDEDYLEVLKHESFAAQDVQEARLSALEAGAEALISERGRHGPAPSHAELLWCRQRRLAFQSLRDARVSTRVVTTSGRLKT